MARKRDDAIKANMAGWLDDAGPDDAGPADLDRAELARAALETARVAYGADATTPATPARARPDKRRMVGVYLDAAEVEALDARAAAEDRSVSYIVRAAVRAYLGMT